MTHRDLWMIDYYRKNILDNKTFIVRLMPKFILLIKILVTLDTKLVFCKLGPVKLQHCL